MDNPKLFESIVGALKSIYEQLEKGAYKETIDIFEPYLSKEEFAEIKERSKRIQESRKPIPASSLLQSEYFGYIKSEKELNSLDSIIDDDEDYNEMENEQNEVELSETIYNNITPFILQAQEVAARFTQMASKGVAGSTSNLFPSASGRGGDAQHKKKRKSGSAFPLNWGLIVSMASNITLDQVKSMLGLLIMVISRTPLTIILKELHRYRMLVSIIYDLIAAVCRRDPKEVATQIIIATFAVISFMNKHDKFLSTVLSVSKYIHSTGAKKRFLFIRLLTLGLFLTNLFKIVNPPPITPIDLIQIVKSQISSKL